MSHLSIEPAHKQTLERFGASNRFGQELRCSHAGETGAVWIYKGILAARPQGDLLEFAQEHLAAESKHRLSLR